MRRQAALKGEEGRPAADGRGTVADPSETAPAAAPRGAPRSTRSDSVTGELETNALLLAGKGPASVARSPRQNACTNPFTDEADVSSDPLFGSKASARKFVDQVANADVSSAARREETPSASGVALAATKGRASADQGNAIPSSESRDAPKTMADDYAA